MDNRPSLCPYLDRRDTRCAYPLTMTNLREAFRLCAGSYEVCSVYHQIRLAQLRPEDELTVVRSA